jgi:Ca2+-binding EF-hand superfamily protein
MWPSLPVLTDSFGDPPKTISPKNAILGSPQKSTKSMEQYKDQQHEFHHVLIPARTKTAESGGVMELKMPYRNQLPFVGTDVLDANSKLKPFNTRTSVVGSTSDLARAISLHVRTNKNRSLQAIFSQYDRDNSGELTKEELKEAMGYYLPGTNITHAAVNRIFKLIDTDGNGGVDYGEFVSFIQEDAARVKAQVGANRQRLQAMKKKWVVHEAGEGGSGMTEAMKRLTAHNKASSMRALRAKQYYTTEHRRFSAVGGFQSGRALPAKGLLEENPDAAFIDPESLTSWKNESQSLTENVRTLKMALYHEINHRTEGIFASLQAEQNKKDDKEQGGAELTKSKRQQMRRTSQVLFDEFDEDGDGLISKDELFKMLRTFLRQSFTLNHGAFAELYRQMDKNGDGGISLEEFHMFITTMKKSELSSKKQKKKQKKVWSKLPSAVASSSSKLTPVKESTRKAGGTGR